MYFRISSLNYLLFITHILYRNTYGYMEDMGQCEPIRIDMCSHLKYNMTKMPNFLGHTTQEEAIMELKPYSRLVNVFNCSQHISFFLCSLFVPMCTQQLDGPLVIEVCRSMCLKVKSDCEPVLTSLRKPWPMNCSRLPESNSKQQLCMAPEVINSLHPTPDKTNLFTPPPNIPTMPVTMATTASAESCPTRYIKYDNSSCTDLCDPVCMDCVPKCDNIYFTEEHKNFAYIWMGIWSSLCILSTLFTVMTFCIEPSRFRYPTRPVVFMAFCYLLYATAYVIRMFIPARDIACKSDAKGDLLFIVNGMESTLCILIFLIQYYFGTASHIWWLVLTLTWYLAASRKWGLEAINSIACYFHLIAWAVPAVLTIAVLVTGKVDSDELTGMCYVGNHNKWALAIYIIIPQGLLLVTGEMFLLAGFAALLRVRTNLKSQVDNLNIRKLEKLMAKIGVFAILYTMPAVCILGSHIHDNLNLETWKCLSTELSAAENLRQSIPTIEIQLLKLLMSFLIGIVTSMWVLNTKTLKSCERRCCHKNRNTVQSHHFKRPSYVMTKQTSSNNYVQRYRLPTHQNVVSSKRSHSLSGHSNAVHI